MGSRKGIGAELVESDKDSSSDVTVEAIARAIALYCAALAGTTSTAGQVLDRAEGYANYILTGARS